MSRVVVYSPRARQHLVALHHWIADESGSTDRADRFVSSVIDYRDGLATPHSPVC